MLSMAVAHSVAVRRKTLQRPLRRSQLHRDRPTSLESGMRLARSPWKCRSGPLCQGGSGLSSSQIAVCKLLREFLRMVTKVMDPLGGCLRCFPPRNINVFERPDHSIKCFNATLAPQFFLNRLLNKSTSPAWTNLGVDFLDQFCWHHDVRPPLSGISTHRYFSPIQHRA